MNVGIFESVQWNASVHRLYLGLYSHPNEILGNGVRTHFIFNSKRKIPSTGSSEEDWTRDAASCRTASPTHYGLSYSGCGLQARVGWRSPTSACSQSTCCSSLHPSSLFQFSYFIHMHVDRSPRCPSPTSLWTTWRVLCPSPSAETSTRRRLSKRKSSGVLWCPRLARSSTLSMPEALCSRRRRWTWRFHPLNLCRRKGRLTWRHHNQSTWRKRGRLTRLLQNQNAQRRQERDERHLNCNENIFWQFPLSVL